MTQTWKTLSISSPLHQAHLKLLYKRATIGITGKKRHRQDDCLKMVNSGNRRSDMVTHDDAETAARNYKDSTEPTFHW